MSGTDQPSANTYLVDALLGRWRWYRRVRQGRWVQYVDGRWVRTYSQEGRYDTCEWYTDV